MVGFTLRIEREQNHQRETPEAKFRTQHIHGRTIFRNRWTTENKRSEAKIESCEGSNHNQTGSGKTLFGFVSLPFLESSRIKDRRCTQWLAGSVAIITRFLLSDCLVRRTENYRQVTHRRPQQQHQSQSDCLESETEKITARLLGKSVCVYCFCFTNWDQLCTIQFRMWFFFKTTRWNPVE